MEPSLIWEVGAPSNKTVTSEEISFANSLFLFTAQYKH